MSVGFHNVGCSSDLCLICWCSMDDIEDVNIKGGIIAHDGNGDTHPWHSECIKEALKVNDLCPYCRIPLDASALFNWKERTVMEIKLINNDAREDLLDASIIGYSGGLAIGLLSLVAGYIFDALRTNFNKGQSVREFELQRITMWNLAGKIFVVIFVGVTIGLVGAKVMNRFLTRRKLPHLDDWVVLD